MIAIRNLSLLVLLARVVASNLTVGCRTLAGQCCYCSCTAGCFQHLNNLQLGSLCDLHDVHEAVQQLTNTKQLQTLVLERMDGVSLQTLRKLLSGCQQLKLLRIRGCDGVALEQAEQFARNVAAWCRSSASIRWAAAAPCDTDDEDDGDQLVPA